MVKSSQPVALVTGSSSGIGRAIAIHLAGNGYKVILNGRKADPSNTTSGLYEVKSLIEKIGGLAEIAAGDISIQEDRRKIVDFVCETFGRLDLLVNNAGVSPKVRKDVLENDEEAFDWMLSVNLKGPYFLTQLIAKKMIEWKNSKVISSPRIAFITSISAYASSTSRPEYCIAKAGLSMTARLYADRLSEFGIQVIEIRPGIISTPMIDKVRSKYEQKVNEGLLPANRLGEPEDVAKVVTAFARGDFDYCTGTVFEVSGGFNIRRL